MKKIAAFPQPFFEAFAKGIIAMLKKDKDAKQDAFDTVGTARGDDVDGLSRPKLDRNR